MSNTPNPFIFYPFCINGDATPISNTGSNSGAVNYQNGFTPNYEYPSTNPSTLPVPRQQFNQLMLDITAGLQQLQLQGYPLFVLSGAGGPVNYPIYSVVAYNAGSGIQIYESLIPNNTSIPGADNNWQVISGSAQAVVPGTIIIYGGVSAPSGYLPCFGTAYPRASYPRLFAAITDVQLCTTNSTDTVTVTNSATMRVGESVEGAGVQPLTTILSITDATTIVLSQTTTASASVNLTFFPWGNGDGSTTFNVPDSKDRAFRGAYGSGSLNVIGNSPGSLGGSDTVTLTEAQMPVHNHPGSTTDIYGNGTSPAVVPGRPYPNAFYPSVPNTYPLTIAPSGGDQAHPNIPPSTVALFCIKV